MFPCEAGDGEGRDFLLEGEAAVLEAIALFLGMAGGAESAKEEVES